MYAMDLWSSKERIGKAPLIALRIIFNSNNGLYKLLKEEFVAHEVRNKKKAGINQPFL